MMDIGTKLTRIVMLGLASTLLAGCVTVVERLIPQASIGEKQFDFLADIELHYAGNTVHARRHYQYFLFRNFDRNGKETSRELASQRVGYVKISDTDATDVVIPDLPPFVGSLSWKIKVGQVYRMQPDAQGEMRCVLLGDGSALVTAKLATLTRLPDRSGGYPDDRAKFDFGLPPRSPKDCRAYLDAGAVDETITPD